MQLYSNKNKYYILGSLLYLIDEILKHFNTFIEMVHT